MAYDKLGMQDGEVVYAEHLDHVEEGISAADVAASNAASAANQAAQSAGNAQGSADSAQQAAEAAQADADAAMTKATDAYNLADSARETANGAMGILPAKADAIHAEASGALITITDGAIQDAVQVVSHIEPVQEGEGDPSPDNVRPISGWDSVTVQRTGKNILPGGGDEKTGSFLLYATDKAFDGAEGREINVSFDFYSPDGSVVSIYAYQQSGLSIGSGYDFFPRTGVYTRYSFNTSITKYGQTLNEGNIIFYSPSGAAVKVKNVQVEFGSTTTVYEPYQGQTLTSDLPETVYGGTLDWTTGVLTVDGDLIAFTGREPWEISNPGGENYFFHTSIGNYGVVVNDSGLCSHYPSEKVGSDNTDVGVRVVNMVIGYAGIAIRPEKGAYSTVDAFKAYLASQYAAGTPVQVAYKLTTPLTIQLTPQQLTMLKGTNNVWSDTGDTSLVYVADTKLYIDQKIAALANSIIQ